MRKRLGLRAATIRTATGGTCGRPITPHGLRATFRTWGEDVGFPRELLEEALGHQIGTAVERAYRRTDSFERRRTVMQAWADFCHGKPFRAPMA